MRCIRALVEHTGCGVVSNFCNDNLLLFDLEVFVTNTHIHAVHSVLDTGETGTSELMIAYHLRIHEAESALRVLAKRAIIPDVGASRDPHVIRQYKVGAACCPDP